MSETRTLADLKDIVAGTPAAPEAAIKREPKRDAQGRAYATGRRKDAVARVWVKPGKGQILINDRPAARYFARPVLRMLITQPFLVADRYQQFDVNCTVVGGGLSAYTLPTPFLAFGLGWLGGKLGLLIRRRRAARRAL